LSSDQQDSLEQWARSIASDASRRAGTHRSAGRRRPAGQGNCDRDEDHPEEGVALAETVPDFGHGRFGARCTSSAWPHADDHGQLIRRVLNRTMQQKPPNGTHWSMRSMAQAAGISEASVRRIWHSTG